MNIHPSVVRSTARTPLYPVVHTRPYPRPPPGVLSAGTCLPAIPECHCTMPRALEVLPSSSAAACFAHLEPQPRRESGRAPGRAPARRPTTAHVLGAQEGGLEAPPQLADVGELIDQRNLVRNAARARAGARAARGLVERRRRRPAAPMLRVHPAKGAVRSLHAARHLLVVLYQVVPALQHARTLRL